MEICFIPFLLNSENWSVLTKFGLPGVSMYDRRNFIVDFLPIDLVTLPKGTVKIVQWLLGSFGFLFVVFNEPCVI